MEAVHFTVTREAERSKGKMYSPVTHFLQLASNFHNSITFQQSHEVLGSSMDQSTDGGRTRMFESFPQSPTSEHCSYQDLALSCPGMLPIGSIIACLPTL